VPFEPRLIPPASGLASGLVLKGSLLGNQSELIVHVRASWSGELVPPTGYLGHNSTDSKLKGAQDPQSWTD
jgi:hypothetical protein